MTGSSAAAAVAGERPADSGPDGATWRLVGREAQIAGIRRALREGRPGVVLAGGPGVGKSRLAREGVRHTEQHRHVAQWLHAPAGGAVPLGAFAALLPEAGRAPGAAPEAVRRVARSLAARGGGRRVVLGVDDAHRLDDASAAVLQHLAATGAVFVVAALRTGEHAPAALTSLWKEGVLDRLEVPALGPQHLEELVHSILGGPVGVPTCQWLCELTQGNVVFLREVLLAGLESGSLVRTGRIWHWQGPLPVSARLADLVDAALGDLEPEEAAVVELLAQGGQVEARLLEARFPAEVLERVERRGLLRSQLDGGRLLLGLADPLQAYVLRTRTPQLRARAGRRELAEAVAGTGARRRGDALRIAGWRLGSGAGTPTGLLVRAAAEALERHDPVLAESTARAALAAAAARDHDGPDDEQPDGPDGEASLLLAAALAEQGRAAEALEQLTGLPDGPDGRVAALRAQVVGWGLGRMQEATDGLAGLGPDAGPAAAAARAALLLGRGDVAGAARTAAAVAGVPGDRPAAPDVPSAASRSLAEAVLTAARALGGRRAGARRTGPRSAAGGHGPLGGLRPGPADATSAPGGPRAVPADGPALAALPGAAAGWPAVAATPVPSPVRTAAAIGVCLADDLTVVAARAEDAYRDSVRRGDVRAAAAGAAVLGRVMLERGRPARARRWLEEAVTIAAGSPDRAFLPAAHAWLAQAHAVLGDEAAAAAALRRAEALDTAVAEVHRPDLRLARAWVLAAGGDLPAAIAAARDAATAAEKAGQPVAAMVAWHAVARLGDPAAATAPLHALAGRLDGPLAGRAAQHAAAAQARDGAALERVSGDFAAIGAGLLAAEAAAEAAAAHTTAGRRGRSLSSAARARTLLEDCEGARTPALIGLRAPDLTQRERQVALLAAQGLSSRAIAERLTVSVRTVDNHLQVAYGKLGINGRRALPEALDAAG